MRIINNMKRKAFTMLELIFVIIIMGIIGKFGVDFLAQSYQSYISSSINNRLQSNSATAVEFVSSRLQYRIKPSTIAREANASYTLLSEYYNTTANILEWIGTDVEGFRGDALPHWSGVIDLNTTVTSLNNLRSPSTNTGNLNTMINILSNGAAGVNDAAIYFVNPDAIITADDWGWDANASRFNTQANVQIHPVKSTATVTDFVPVTWSTGASANNNLSGVEASEYYQLAWSAYAVGINNWNPGTGTGTLTMWYNYQPWKGERYDLNGSSMVIMEDVSSFRFIASDSVVKIQVCVKSDLLANEEYSICKEKTIY